MPEVFFHCPSYPGFKKCEVTSKILLLENVVLWSRDWRNTEKRNFYWISSVLQLTFLQEHQAQFLHFGLNRNCSTCRKVLLWKIGDFMSCVTIGIVRKFWKNAIIIDLSHYSNWSFSTTPSLSSSIKTSIKSFALVEDDSIKNPLLLILASKSWGFKISRKLLLSLIDLDYQNGVSL